MCVIIGISSYIICSYTIILYIIYSITSHEKILKFFLANRQKNEYPLNFFSLAIRTLRKINYYILKYILYIKRVNVLIIILMYYNYTKMRIRVHHSNWILLTLYDLQEIIRDIIEI